MLEKNNLLSNLHPSFFIIGTQKSGTSTLYKWLRQDKRLVFPKIKETHFFTSNYNYGIDWYLDLFIKHDIFKVRGEVDPSYIFSNLAIKRILKLNKNAKFIILLRSPLERAYSQYLMSVFRGYEKLSFIEALDLEKKRVLKDDFSYNNFSYLKRSQYSQQIKYLFNETNNLLFIKFNNLFIKENQINSIKQIYKFLNLEYFDNIDFSISSNIAKQYKSKYLTNLLYSDNLIRNIFRRLVPSYISRYKIKLMLSKLNSKRIDNNKDNYSEMIKKLPLKYIDWHNSEVKNTSKLTKLDLEDWII